MYPVEAKGFAISRGSLDTLRHQWINETSASWVLSAASTNVLSCSPRGLKVIYRKACRFLILRYTTSLSPILLKAMALKDYALSKLHNVMHSLPRNGTDKNLKEWKSCSNTAGSAAFFVSYEVKLAWLEWHSFTSGSCCLVIVVASL